MKNIIKIICVIGISLIFCGCMPKPLFPSQLKQPLPKNTRIGVISIYGDEATFHGVGFLGPDGWDYKHVLPGLQMDKHLTSGVSYYLKVKGYRSLAINNINAESYVPALLLQGFCTVQLSDGEKKLLISFRKKYNVDYLLIIRPDIYAHQIWAGADNYYTKVHGCGVFSIGRVWLFGAYDIVLLDLKAKKLWRHGGQFDKVISKRYQLNSYDKYSKQQIQYIVKNLQIEMARSVNGTIFNLMYLPE